MTNKRRFSLELAAVTVFLVVSLPIVYLGRGERSAYVQTFTSFPGGQAGFGLFGGNYILGDQPFMAENDLYVKQILMFSGDPDSVQMHFTATRPTHAFVASLFAPFVGVIGGQIIANFLGWALAAWIAWRFTIALCSDRFAAFLAVVFVSGGLGFVIHSHDYSPHLIPFTMYYAGVLVLFESGVWRDRQPLRIHVMIGLFLALATLTYTMGFGLVAAYIAISIWRNRWLHVLLAVALGLTSHLIYTAGLNAINGAVTGAYHWVTIDGSESDKLARSLEIWRMTASDPAALLARVLNGIKQFSFFEIPPIVGLGLASWFFVLRRERALWWFFAVLFAVPFAGGMAYLNYSTTRGYVVYGTTLLIYAPLAAWIASGMTSRYRSVAIGIATIVITAQLLWSTGFLYGYIIPAKAFFGFGYVDWIPKYIWQLTPPPAISFTGLEPTARLFGGSATLADAGMFVVNDVAHGTYRMPLAFASRAVLMLYLVLFVAALGWTARRRFVTAALLVVGVGIIAALVPQVLPPGKPAVLSTFYTINVPPKTTLDYQVLLSDKFLTGARRYQDLATKVQFVTPAIHAPFVVQVVAGDNDVLVESHEGGMLQESQLPVTAVLDTLSRSKQLSFRVTTTDKGLAFGTSVFGWQRNGLPNRRLWNATTRTPWDAVLLPALELRLLDAEGRAIYIGF